MMQDMFIGENTIIDDKVRLGKNVKIGANNKITGDTILENVTIGDNNVITQSIIKDAIIGNDNQIGPFTHIHEQIEINDGNILGSFVEIKRSYLGSGNKIKHHAYLGDAILEDNINIGAGMITANYCFKDKKKYQTVIKSESNLGANAVLIAPITIGKRVIVGAGSVVDQDILDDSLVIERSTLVVKQRKDREYDRVNQ